MRLFALAILCLAPYLVAYSLAANLEIPSKTSQFAAWWGASIRQKPKGGIKVPNKPTFKEKKVVLSELSESDLKFPVPASFKSKSWVALSLAQLKGREIILLVPRDSIDWEKNDHGCGENKVWMNVAPVNQWTTLDINPYCDPGYGPEEVFFTLYYLSENEIPLVSIEHSTPAGAVFQLFFYDPKETRYRLLREEAI
ncbi:MAG: hypothetical protein KCHDKBKB_02282 [Elusimicrobia bacterium]|nr:hypothetical protein [Elusimicrobiota bacterium]